MVLKIEQVAQAPLSDPYIDGLDKISMEMRRNPELREFVRQIAQRDRPIGPGAPATTPIPRRRNPYTEPIIDERPGHGALPIMGPAREVARAPLPANVAAAGTGPWDINVSSPLNQIEAQRQAVQQGALTPVEQQGDKLPLQDSLIAGSRAAAQLDNGTGALGALAAFGGGMATAERQYQQDQAAAAQAQQAAEIEATERRRKAAQEQAEFELEQEQSRRAGRQADRKFEAGRADADRDFKLKEAKLQMDQAAAKKDPVVTYQESDGKLVGLTRSGKVIDTGLAAGKKAAKQYSATDAMKAAEQLATKKVSDGVFEKEIFDPNVYNQAVKALGHPELAQESAGQAAGGVPSISTQAEYDQLPSGTVYMAPDGQQRTKQ